MNEEFVDEAAGFKKEYMDDLTGIEIDFKEQTEQHLADLDNTVQQDDLTLALDEDAAQETEDEEVATAKQTEELAVAAAVETELLSDEVAQAGLTDGDHSG